jgi:hypothetical protein
MQGAEGIPTHHGGLGILRLPSRRLRRHRAVGIEAGVRAFDPTEHRLDDFRRRDTSGTDRRDEVRCGQKGEIIVGHGVHLAWAGCRPGSQCFRCPFLNHIA